MIVMLPAMPLVIIPFGAAAADVAYLVAVAVDATVRIFLLYLQMHHKTNPFCD